MILIVDDDPAQRRMLGALLDRAGQPWRGAESGEAALALMSGAVGAAVTLLLLDLAMPGLSGVETLTRLRPAHPDLPVLALTSHGSVANAVAAMKAGANDFLIKPVAPGRLIAAVEAGLRLRAHRRRGSDKRVGGEAVGFDALVAEAEATRRAIRIAARGARASIPILIEGESGVGKEVFARAIHAASPREAGPFVAVNCGALPEALVESILFGHEKGAFTGAVARRIGKFQEAGGGTLFLDEIGDLPLSAQVKLLRAIQEGEIDPVGGAETVKCDFRLISATNRDLRAEVAAGRFREDLFYRVSVYPLALPPLRERREDIAPLARQFARRFATEGAGTVADLTDGALAALTAADWPGNVRELENAVYRAVVLAEGGPLTEADFAHAAAPEVAPAQGAASPYFGADGHIRKLADIEEEVMIAALSRYDGSMTEAAKRLGVGRSTLYRRLGGRGETGVR